MASLLLAALALWPVYQFLGIACARIGYPFELEWMEGAVVDHVRIVLSGQMLYRKPSLEFTPFIYVPGYYYLSAVMTKIFGLGFFAPRLVSLLATVGCFAAIGVWIHRETHSIVGAAVGAGLFAGTYGLSAFWFDIARCDSLYLLLLLLGYLYARRATTLGRAIACGVLLGCAAFTKQMALVLAVPALAFTVAQSPRLGRWAVVAFVSFVGLTMGTFEIASRGWFGFYAFRVPADHEILWHSWHSVLSEHFLTPVLPMVLGAMSVVAGVSLRERFWVWAMHAAWIVSAAAVSFMAILHTGGYPNVLMSFHAALAIASGITFGALWQPRTTRLSAFLFGRRAFAVAVVVLQFLLLPEVKRNDLVPSEADREAGLAMLRRVAACPQPVWMLSSGFYPWLMHRSPVMAHAMAIGDVFKSKQTQVKKELLAEINGQIREKKFQTIVRDRADGFLPGEITGEINRYYRLKERLQGEDAPHFWPKSGAWVRPDQIWTPTETP